MTGIEIFVLLLSACARAGLPHQYTKYSLDKLCGHKINLGKKPGVFTLDGAVDDDLECEVELVSASSQFGLYVFIDELKINKTPGCSEDFLQFGR